jgi:type II secretory pathway component PulF
LEQDIQQGTPFRQAVQSRRLPEFYVQMLQVGAQSNDLPGILVLLADYYERIHSIWTRLKGLVVYPVIVAIMATALSLGMAFIGHQLIEAIADEASARVPVNPASMAGLAIIPAGSACIMVVLLAIALIPPLRRSVGWILPGFKEAALSQFAAAMSLMLRKGCPLSQALEVSQQMEMRSPLGKELATWRKLLAAGEGKFSAFGVPGRMFTPLFVWLVGNAGEDLAGGFDRAAEIYSARAIYRVEMMLYAALPVAVVILGVIILGQIVPVAHMGLKMLDMVSDLGV